MIDLATIADPEPWRDALADFSRGNAEPLAALLRTDPVPDYLRGELADAIAAAPLKRGRNADKAMTTAAQERFIAKALHNFERIVVGIPLDEMRNRKIVAKLRKQLHADVAGITGLKPDSIRKRKRGK